MELLLSPQDLEALRQGLHHPVLDAIVDHLDEVPRAAGADVGVAIFHLTCRSQAFEGRFQALKSLPLPTDHQAVTDFQAPDTSAGADVQKVNAPLAQHLRPADGVPVVGIAAINEDVARLDKWKQPLDHLLHWIARRNHNPDGAG